MPHTKNSIYRTKGKKIGMVAVNGLENYTICKKQIQKGINKLKKETLILLL